MKIMILLKKQVRKDVLRKEKRTRVKNLYVKLTWWEDESMKCKLLIKFYRKADIVADTVAQASFSIL